MDLQFLLVMAATGLIAGVLIGCVGIGGVLLVPALVYLGGIEVHVAIATCLWVFLFSGAAGTALFARRGSIDWRMAAWIGAGAVPTAFLGALVMALTPGRALEFIIAALVLFGGVSALGRGRASAPRADRPGATALAAVGALTGFGSALSGTGGPLILVPVLVWLRLPALAVVALGQVIQIPVAAFATIGNLVGGALDFALGTAIAAALVVGVVAGARLAHAVQTRTLERIVAVVLVLTGAFLLARLALGPVAA